MATIEVAKILSPLQSLDTTDQQQIVDFIKGLGWDLGNILETEYQITLDIDQFSASLTSIIDDTLNLRVANDGQAAMIAANIVAKVVELVTQAIEISNAIKRIIEDIGDRTGEVIGPDLVDAPARFRLYEGRGEARTFAGQLASGIADLEQVLQFAKTLDDQDWERALLVELGQACRKADRLESARVGHTRRFRAGLLVKITSLDR